MDTANEDFSFQECSTFFFQFHEFISSMPRNVFFDKFFEVKITMVVLLPTYIFKASNVSLDGPVVLFCDMDRLLVLLYPAWLPGVIFHYIPVFYDIKLRSTIEQ